MERSGVEALHGIEFPEPQLSWTSKVVIRMLLLVAEFMCLDPEWRKEVRHLANHIAMGPPSGK